MKLRVFFATDGDCLLLTSNDGLHVLIDGGRARSFQSMTEPTLQRIADDGEAIELVVVSHIDADHISGILTLLQAVAAWEVYDYQVGDGNNPNFQPPTQPRPPQISGLWHNSWRAQLGELAAPIEALVGRVSASLELAPVDESTSSVPTMQTVESLRDLSESIPDGIELMRLVDDDTSTPRNVPFKSLVLLMNPPHVEKVGSMDLTVIGPAKKHLERLRGEWRTWMAQHQAATTPGNSVDPGATNLRDADGLGMGATDFSNALLADARSARDVITAITSAAEIIHMSDPKKVTPPNRASIVLLAEEGGRTCLLTGDAAEEEILEGLRAAGRLDNGPFWCNVVKVQHHGSEYNLSEMFAGQVLADQYVFCADGAHKNPDPSVVKTIIATRASADPRPFTVWFNCSESRTLPERKAAMRAAIKEAHKQAGQHPGTVTVNVLDDNESFFEIEV